MYTATIDCTELDPQYNAYVSDIVDVGDSVKLQFKIPKGWRVLHVSPILPDGEKKIYGKLYVQFFTEVYDKKTEFLIDLSGRAWRAVMNGPAVFKHKNNSQVTIYCKFTRGEKTASSIIQPVKGLRVWDTDMAQFHARRRAYVQVSNRERFGYVGLKNAGATCYLNSVIQVLFNIPVFRRLIYSVDALAINKAPSENILLNLQILFFKMQTSKTSCSTNPLMISFGWVNERSIQNDATEMWMVFTDNIRNKLTGSTKDRFDELFGFRSHQKKECREIGYQEIGSEQFLMSLMLTVYNGDTIQQLVNASTEPEWIDGYQIEGHPSKVTITMHQEFVSAPEILLVQLNRYDMDYQTGELVKITKPIDFDETLDFPTTDGVIQYKLHGIMVHEGGCQGGHYYAYIKPTMKDEWLYFSDEHLARADIGEIKKRALSNGYFFVWMRNDTEEVNYTEVTLDEIPTSIETLSETVELSTTEIIVINSDSLIMNSSECKSGYRHSQCERQIDIGSSDTISALYEKVQTVIGLQANQFSLWKCKPNGQPIELLKKGAPDAVRTIGNSRIIYIDNSPYDEAVDDTRFIFIKHFDARRRTVEIVSSMLARTNMSVADIFASPSTNITLPPGGIGSIHFFVEKEGNNAEKIASGTLIESLENGTVIVYQSDSNLFAVTEEDSRPKESQAEDICDYYLINSVGDGLYPFFLEYKHRSVTGHLCFSNDLSVYGPMVRFPAAMTMAELKTFLSPCCGLEWNPEENSIVVCYQLSGSFYFAPKKNDVRQPMSTGDDYGILLHCYEDINEQTLQESTLKTQIVYISEDSINISRMEILKLPGETTVPQVIEQIGLSDASTRLSIMQYGHIESLIDKPADLTIDKCNGDLRVDILTSPTTSPILPVYIEPLDKRMPKSFYIDIREGELSSATKDRILQMSGEQLGERRFRITEASKGIVTLGNAVKLSESTTITHIRLDRYYQGPSHGSIMIYN